MTTKAKNLFLADQSKKILAEWAQQKVKVKGDAGNLFICKLFVPFLFSLHCHELQGAAMKCNVLLVVSCNIKRKSPERIRYIAIYLDLPSECDI